MNRKKTKTMKITTSTMNEEECGVWLDTEQLRMKKQQKKQMRPILKLLNPLARSGGYSTGVSLSFTQTKHPMPPTRQSTISAFFAPRSKEADVHATEIGSTSPIGAYTGRKRKHEMEFVVPEEQNQEVNESTPENRREEKVNSETGGKVHDAKDCDKEQQFFHLIGGYQSDEEEPPAEKRRTLENCSLLRTSETEKTFGENTLTKHRIPEKKQGHPASRTVFSWDHNTFESQGHRLPTNGRHLEQRKNGHFDAIYPERFQSKANLRPQRIMDENISVWQPPSRVQQSVPERLQRESKDQDFGLSQMKPQLNKWSVRNGRGKENMPSPIKQPLSLNTGSMSNVRMNYWSSSQKLVTEHHLMEDEGDACAILFTQDSEGFRVIAHRGNQSRSPLKDQTNVTACRTYRNVLPTPSPPEMKGESDSEPEMVFTQDSEGNVVIKH